MATAAGPASAAEKRAGSVAAKVDPDSIFPTESDGHLNNVFAKISLRSLKAPGKGTMVVVSSDDTVASAVQDLVANDILCAPVRDASASDDESWAYKYLGTLDSVGVLFWMLDRCKSPPKSFQEMLTLNKEFQETKVKDILGADPSSLRFGPFVPLDPDRNTMLDLMLILGRYALHRAFVCETSGDIIAIVTQTRVVEVLHANLALLKDIADKTLEELGLIRKRPLVIANLNDTFWSALLHLREKYISAVPVVNDEGVLCGSLSATDARMLLTEPGLLASLHKPLSTLAKFKHQPFDTVPITAKATDTLAECIVKLANKHTWGHVHRLWVVDEANKPIDVLSLRDVIARFVKEPRPDYFGSYFWA